MTDKLVIDDLHVSVDGEEILKGVSLSLREGELCAVMGPNGSGKSTLAHTIMGHPKYEVTGGSIEFNGKDVTELDADERARLGIFLGFQYPSEIPGVTVANFLLNAYKARNEDVDMREFMSLLKARMEELGVDERFSRRYLNEGFSGGEKKRMEILQMAVLEPDVAVLDEIDSGLDIDALKVVADGINKLREGDRSFLLITHYQRILDYVEPNRIFVMRNGRIVEEGGPEVARQLEEHGYEGIAE